MGSSLADRYAEFVANCRRFEANLRDIDERAAPIQQRFADDDDRAAAINAEFSRAAGHLRLIEAAIAQDERVLARLREYESAAPINRETSR